MVERVNGILKAKINKICQDANLNWIDALPLALMCYRSQESRITHLSPHEMLTGRRMPVPQIRGQSEGPPLEALDLALKLYMQQLSVIHRTILEQEQAREPETAAQDQPVQAGDLVYIIRFRRRWNEERREGPFQVTRTSPTALQVEDGLYWYHLRLWIPQTVYATAFCHSHCTRAIDRETEEAEDVPREDGDDPGEGPSGVVLFDISPPGQPGDGHAHGESEPRRPQGGTDVPPPRDTSGQLDALDECNTPGPSHEPHLFGDRAGISTIDFSHLSAD